MRLTAQEFHADEAHFPRVQFEIRSNTAKSALILDAVSIAGRVCAQPEALANAFTNLFPCTLLQKGTVLTFTFPHHTISAAADASICAVRHHETEFLELAQMANPVSLHDGYLYLPLEEFLHVLHETGVVTVEQDESVITLSSEQTSPLEDTVQNSSETIPATTTTTETTTFYAPNDDAPSNTVTQTISTKNDAKNDDAKTLTKFDKPTRNRYILPNDLKRRGLDTPPRMNYLPRGSKNAASGTVQLLLLRTASFLTLSDLIASNISDDAKKKAVTARSSTQTKSSLQSQTEKTSHSKKKQVSQSKTNSTNSSDNDFSSAKKKWALDVIVLDAGHGGKDGGTIGVGKTKEKDVALAIVKKLGAFIKKEMPGTKVVYTRTDDTFVELDRRGQIANENGGKLFVSIHCNATPKKPSKANGFEVYILRPGRNEDAVRIAEVENSVIKLEDDPKRYKPLTDEQFIVVSMAQSAFVKYSDLAAAMITAEVKKLKDIGVRGVNQAGFLVLVGASMPNMLIETGFLSNEKEEKFLKSAAGQTKLALAICRAIKAYRINYEAQIRGTAEIMTIKTPDAKSSTQSSTKKNTTKKNTTKSTTVKTSATKK